MRRPELENEANVFALLLLMPKEKFEKEIKGMSLVDDAAYIRIAKLFDVPLTAVAARWNLLTQHNI